MLKIAIGFVLIGGIVVVNSLLIREVFYLNREESDTFENWEQKWFEAHGVVEESDKEMYRQTFDFSAEQLRYSIKDILCVVGKSVDDRIQTIK